MTYQQVFKTHYSQKVRESVLKSAIFGLLIGLAAASVIAFITIFTDFNGLWLAIGVGIGLTAVMIPMLYIGFRPTENDVAESLDRLGFDERVITMRELEGNDSFMADIQRKDTFNKLTAAADANGKIHSAATTAQKLEALGLNKVTWIIGGIILAIAIITLVLTGLPSDRIKELFIGTNTYTITYNAGQHGYIVTESGGYKYDDHIDKTGKYSMTVKHGEPGERIVVTAYDNPGNPYMFTGWSDGYTDQYNAASRYTDKVYEGYSVTATYQQIGVVEDDPNDSLGDALGDHVVPPMTGDGGDPGKPDKPSEFSPPTNSAGGGAGGLYEEIIDGETDYHENFQKYYDEAMSRLAEGKEIPESLRKIINAYFEALK